MSSGFGDTTGSKILTASGEIGVAGKPCRLFAIHFISTGTVGVVSLKNNGTSGTEWIKLTGGAINTGQSVDFGSDGILFPLGAYWTKDANTTSLVATYRQEN